MKKWSDKTTLEKIAEIISAIALCVWLIFGLYEKAEKLPYAEMITYISATVICACQAFTFWKEKRVISYIALAGVACMIATIILGAF